MSEIRTRECERARGWISAALDRELSQFEAALLAHHVRTCETCSAFDERVAAITALLRTSRAERMRGAVYLPSRQRVASRTYAVAGRLGSVAAVVACVVSFGLFAPSDRGALNGEQALVAAPLEQGAGMNELVVDVRRKALVRGQQAVIAYGTGGIGAYKPPLAPVP